MMALSDTLEQMDLIDIPGTFYPDLTENILWDISEKNS